MNDLLIFNGIGLIGGLLAAVTGASFIIVLPTFMILGLSGLQALLLGRVMCIACLGTTTLYLTKRKAFDWRMIRLFLEGSILGVIIGAGFTARIPNDVFALALPVMLTICLPLIYVRTCRLHFQGHAHWLQPAIGFLVGIWVALGGNGGITIPIILMWLLATSFKQSVFYTRAIEFIFSIFAVIGYFLFGAELSLALIISTVIGGLIGGFLGAHIVFHVKSFWLKAVVTVMGLIMLAKLTFFP